MAHENWKAKANQRQSKSTESGQDMARPSDRYIAGFLDSDGSIEVLFEKTRSGPRLKVGFSQKEDQDEVVHLIHQIAGGYLRTRTVKGINYTELCIVGRKATTLLERVRKYLVVKRHYADVCLDVCSRPCAYEDRHEVRKHLKDHRRQRSLPLPKHPTRGWLAGYLDGNGCFTVEGIRAGGGAKLCISASAWKYDTEGLEIIQKQFGGKLNGPYGVREDQPHSGHYVWQLRADSSKIVSFLPDIVRHMIVKRDQADLIVKCAERDHLRNGEYLKAELKRLKATPHRLLSQSLQMQAMG